MSRVSSNSSQSAAERSPRERMDRSLPPKPPERASLARRRCMREGTDSGVSIAVAVSSGVSGSSAGASGASTACSPVCSSASSSVSSRPCRPSGGLSRRVSIDRRL